MHRNFSLVVFLFICVCAATGNAYGEVKEWVLDNGLKVVVKEDHRTPVAISQVWYKVGSANEYNGITGVSHVLEHMMFKGTTKYPSGQFSRILAENGARDNAFTGQDYTAYYQLLEKSRLPIAFELEADRMRNLILQEKEFISELEVVKEERRLRTDDNPNALTYEQLLATAFVNGPYHHPVIGWMQDLNTLKRDDLAHWYAQWYAPNNATLVVVGDVNYQEVYQLAKKYFGVHAKSTVVNSKPRTEIQQLGEKRITVKAKANVPYLLMGFKAPSLITSESSWEPYALAVLAGILDGGNSSRLNKHLVRGTEIAASANADYSLYDAHTTLFMLEGTPAADRTIDELEQALLKEIKTLQDELIASAELERVKAQVIAGEVYQQDSISYQANIIGILETVGLGWKKMDEYVDRINQITAEQVREVARKYLVSDLKTIAVLQPVKIQDDKS